jgi:hypothetical protein
MRTSLFLCSNCRIHLLTISSIHFPYFLMMQKIYINIIFNYYNFPPKIIFFHFGEKCFLINVQNDAEATLIIILCLFVHLSNKLCTRFCWNGFLIKIVDFLLFVWGVWEIGCGLFCNMVVGLVYFWYLFRGWGIDRNYSRVRWMGSFVMSGCIFVVLDLCR